MSLGMDEVEMGEDDAFRDDREAFKQYTLNLGSEFRQTAPKPRRGQRQLYAAWRRNTRMGDMHDGHEGDGRTAHQPQHRRHSKLAPFQDLERVKTREERPLSGNDLHKTDGFDRQRRVEAEFPDESGTVKKLAYLGV